MHKNWVHVKSVEEYSQNPRADKDHEVYGKGKNLRGNP